MYSVPTIDRKWIQERHMKSTLKKNNYEDARKLASWWQGDEAEAKMSRNIQERGILRDKNLYTMVCRSILIWLSQMYLVKYSEYKTQKRHLGRREGNAKGISLQCFYSPCRTLGTNRNPNTQLHGRHIWIVRSYYHVWCRWWEWDISHKEC